MKARAPARLLGALAGLGVLACDDARPPEPPPDMAPPTVRLVSPRLGQVGAVLQVNVRGELEDDRGVVRARWALNGAPPVELTPSATFGFQGAARPGDNLLRVEAEDAAGNTGLAEVRFTVGSVLAGGLSHSAAVRAGQLYTWGDNSAGQLGVPGVEGSATPLPVPGLTAVRTVVAGPSSTLTINDAGAVWAWGALPSGLVPARSGPPAEPVRVETPGPVVGAALGAGHALLLLEDGTVLAAGSNTRGQLGLGHTAPVDTRVRVPGLSRIVHVAVGSEHSVALREDGTVFVWGANGDGQLGNGELDSAPHPEPLQVPHLGRVVDVAAGRGHVLVLEEDGRARAWGQGSSGQLGHGQSGILGGRAQPVEVLDIPPAVAVFAGANVSLALDASGRLRAWGQNSNGQLGDGTLAERPQAVGVRDLGPVRAVGVGAQHTLAATDTGVLAWGANGSGQLGSDTPARASLPRELAFP